MSQIDSNILQLLGISGRILVPPMTQLFRSKWLIFSFSERAVNNLQLFFIWCNKSMILLDHCIKRIILLERAHPLRPLLGQLVWPIISSCLYIYIHPPNRTDILLWDLSLQDIAVVSMEKNVFYIFVIIYKGISKKLSFKKYTHIFLHNCYHI